MCANIKTKVYFQTAAFTLHNDTMQCILSVYCRLLLIFIHSLHIEPYTPYIEAFDHTDTNDRSNKSWLGWRQTATGEKTICWACITLVPRCIYHMCTTCTTICNSGEKHGWHMYQVASHYTTHWFTWDGLFTCTAYWTKLYRKYNCEHTCAILYQADTTLYHMI